MADPGFDPRFDPAFQPGFDPSRHPSGMKDVTTRVPTASPTSPEVEPGAAAFVSAPSVSAPSGAAAEMSAVPADLPARARRRNPLIILLWIMSVVLVASGVYGLRLVADRVKDLGSSGGFGEADYYLMQAYTVLAPLLIALGIATAIGTIFLLATRFQGKN